MIIGIDPDSEAHGVAYFDNKKLVKLEVMTLPQIIDSILHYFTLQELHFSIENVMANQFVYGRNERSNKTVQSKIAMHVGRCQQSQVELCRMLDFYEVSYELHRPTKSNWAKDKKKFEMITGWNGSSNEDKRSAAYFGWLAATK